MSRDQIVSLTNEADLQLDQMVKLVNEDFTSGKVKKNQLVCWLINDLMKNGFQKKIKKIRDDHFDQITHLKNVVKKMEEAKRNDSNVELSQLLSPLKTSVAKVPKPTPANAEEK